jgi:hypothetical protein
MNILLKEDEIKQALKEANDKAQDYGDDLQPLPERNVAKAQLKKVYEWGLETCDNENHWQYKCGDVNIRLHPLYRRNCADCWSELKKEIEG